MHPLSSDGVFPALLVSNELSDTEWNKWEESQGNGRRGKKGFRETFRQQKMLFTLVKDEVHFSIFPYFEPTKMFP